MDLGTSSDDESNGDDGQDLKGIKSVNIEQHINFFLQHSSLSLSDATFTGPIKYFCNAPDTWTVNCYCQITQLFQKMKWQLDQGRAVKKYEKRTGSKYDKFVMCLGNMAVQSEHDDFLEYSG